MISLNAFNVLSRHYLTLRATGNWQFWRFISGVCVQNYYQHVVWQMDGVSIACRGQMYMHILLNGLLLLYWTILSQIVYRISIVCWSWFSLLHQFCLKQQNKCAICTSIHHFICTHIKKDMNDNPIATLNEWMNRFSNLHTWHEWALYIRIIRNRKFYSNNLSIFNKINTENIRWHFRQ